MQVKAEGQEALSLREHEVTFLQLGRPAVCVLCGCVTYAADRVLAYAGKWLTRVKMVPTAVLIMA